MESFASEHLLELQSRALSATAFEEQAVLARHPDPFVLKGLARNPFLDKSLQGLLLERAWGKWPDLAIALLKRSDLEMEHLFRLLEAKEPSVRREALLRGLRTPDFPPEKLHRPFLAFLKEGGLSGLAAVGNRYPHIEEVLKAPAVNPAFWSALEVLLQEEGGSGPSLERRSDRVSLLEKGIRFLGELLEREDAPFSLLAKAVEVGGRRNSFLDEVLERELPPKSVEALASSAPLSLSRSYLERLVSQKSFGREALKKLASRFYGDPRVVVEKVPWLTPEDGEFLIEALEKRLGAHRLDAESWDLVHGTLKLLSERGLLTPSTLEALWRKNPPIAYPALALALEREDVPLETMVQGYLFARGLLEHHKRTEEEGVALARLREVRSALRKRMALEGRSFSGVEFLESLLDI